MAGLVTPPVPRHRDALNYDRRVSAPYRSGQSRDWLKIKNPNSPAMIRARKRSGDARCRCVTRWPVAAWGWKRLALRLGLGRRRPPSPACILATWPRFEPGGAIFNWLRCNAVMEESRDVVKTDTNTLNWERAQCGRLG